MNNNISSQCDIVISTSALFGVAGCSYWGFWYVFTDCQLM